MALSQLQCLDDNHVNPRTHESKPEFFYCEDQRLALEVLLRDGREAFFKYLEARGLRGFLSDPELETLAGAAEPFDPDLEMLPENVKDDPTPVSMQYWPELSDISIPQMDLGWPDCDAYRGVTRTTVYTQPPLEGQVHVKEVVRKMIAQAQKVIAVVMDVFTDVDIFRDLLDAGFKRKVSVYILLERSALPHFLSMCQRANMHAGHLKHLRVRCTIGAEFYTRSCTKVRGRMGHRFMFIDGDKAVSGSYGFTWMSSRLDRNLITVVTGQAVDGFDRLFRILYATSSAVDLRQVNMEPEPEPDPPPQLATVGPPSAAVARKLYNPKYALVAASNPSPTTSAGCDTPKEPQNPESPKIKKRRRAHEEDAPPLHPGLMNLEKACLISYLPIWPEPDPSSDVIGFINIRDANRPTQVHLQRSEMFETSQAIKFSSPFSKAKETLPEVAKPGQLTAKHEEINIVQPLQNKTKAEELVVAQPAPLNVAPGDTKNKEEAPEQKSPASGQKPEPDKGASEAVHAENKLHSNTTTKQEAGHYTPDLSAHTLPQSNSKAPPPNTPTASQTTYTRKTVSTNRPKSDPLPELNTKDKAETVTSLNTQSSAVYRTHTLELNSKQTSQLPDHANSNSNIERDTPEKTVVSCAGSHSQAIHTQSAISSEVTPNIQTPIVHKDMSTSSVSSSSLSVNNHITVTTEHSSTATSVSVPSTSSPSSLFPLSSSFTMLNPPLPSSSSSESSSLISAPPVPKPRTVQLVIKDTSASNDQKLPEICVVRRPETSAGPLVVHNEPADVQTSPVKEPETIPQTIPSKITENTGKPKETQLQNQTSQETKGKEADGWHNGRARPQLVAGNKLQTQSDVLITDAPKAASVDIQEIFPKDENLKTSTTTDCKIIPKREADSILRGPTDTKAPEKTLTGCEFAKMPNDKSENVTQYKTYLARVDEPQTVSYSQLTAHNIDVLDVLDPLKAPVHTPVSTSFNLNISKDGADDGTRSKQARFAAAHGTDSMLNTLKHSTHSTFQEQVAKARERAYAPERAMRLHLSDTYVPDLRTPTPERELRSLRALARTPTPDGFPPRTPTPDSRTTTPDPRSNTPDFRSPTSDISDGYVSPLSTTSEEYYECSDSNFYEPFFDHMGHMTEDHVGFTHTNTPNAASNAFINYSPGVGTLGTADRNTSTSETQALDGPSKDPSSSSLWKKIKDISNEENGREEDEKGRKLSVMERRAEQESQGAEKRDSKEASRRVDHDKEDYSTETAEKGKEVQAAKRKRVLNQSARVDGGVTTVASTSEGTEPKQFSTSHLKPETVSSEGPRPNKVFSWKEKALNKVGLRPSSGERSDVESERQKLLYTSSKPERGQQQDAGASSTSRPPRPPRPLSATQHLGPRPWGSSHLNQRDNKELRGSFQVSDNSSSARRPPSRPPHPGAVGSVESAAVQKQVSHSQQTLLPQLPPAAQSRAKAEHTQNKTPYQKPQASFLHTHSNLQPQSPPHSQNQMVSAQEAHEQEEGRAPFSFTFSRLYNLKGLKDKMSKVPAQSKKGSTSPPVQRHKSTS